MRKFKFMSGLALVAVGCFSATANAGTVLKSSISHGVGNCRGPRFSDESAMRRNAMGIWNEGDKAIWITCDLDLGPNWPNYASEVGISAVTVAFQNDTYNDIGLKCTLVDGILGVADYYPKEAVVNKLPYGGAAVPTWTAEDDNGGKLFAAPAVTCSLPKGVHLSYVQVRYFDEVGQ